jgi:hypothetical protein
MILWSSLNLPEAQFCHLGAHRFMQRFHASSFATVMTELARVFTAVSMADSAGLPPDDELDRSTVQAALERAKPALAELPLSRVVQTQFLRIEQAIERQAKPFELAILLREFHDNLLVELASAWFLMIPADRRFAYEQPYPIFGPDVYAAFPDARRDIAAAGRCYALDEWTACVMHCMRALEFGLRWLGGRVKLDALETKGENWKNVIDQIEKKVRQMENEPKSEDKSKRLQFLSEAAAQFRWFKDAWRNDAAHSHSHYDEREGAPLFLHVSDFFRHIAAQAMRDSSSE